MRLACHRVPEENEVVDFLLRYQRTELLVATKWAAFKAFDVREHGREHFPCSACSIELIAFQFVSMFRHLVKQKFLFGVVSHQCDYFFHLLHRFYYFNTELVEFLDIFIFDRCAFDFNIFTDDVPFAFLCSIFEDF